MNYIETWKEVIQRPFDFYRRMPTTGGYADPLIFAAISFFIYGLLNTLTGVLLSRAGYMDGLMLGGTYGVGEFSSSMIILYVIITPILGIIFLLIEAAILNIIYESFGGTGNYEGTVRFISYAAAVSLLSWIPILTWIFSIYSLYLYIVGGMIVHKVSMWKSVVTILLGLLAIVLLVFAIVVAVIIILAIFGQ